MAMDTVPPAKLHRVLTGRKLQKLKYTKDHPWTMLRPLLALARVKLCAVLNKLP